MSNRGLCRPGGEARRHEEGSVGILLSTSVSAASKTGCVLLVSKKNFTFLSIKGSVKMCVA